MNVSNTAFICGYFTALGTTPSPAGWTPVAEDAAQETLLRKFYFPEFVDFHTRGVRRFTLPVDQEVALPLRSGAELAFRVEELRLWLMPYSLAIFAIKTVFTGQPIDAVTETLNTLRNCSFYEQSALGGFRDAAIRPLNELYTSLTARELPADGSYAHLVENGNKFKIFQIITTPDCPAGYEERNRLLYAAGTLSRYEEKPPFSTDPAYYEQLMKAHRVGVFSSWTALALLDTVTFLGGEVSPFQQTIWIEDYFGKIYIYELFRKCFLYHHNLLFRTGQRDPVVLQEELTDFERRYTFTAVSYNFLPVEVDEAVVRGLGVEKEEASLARLVAQEATAREEESAGKRDRFLLFLTCLASLSAVWDISCLLDEVINYEDTFSVANWGYRLFASVLLVLIAVVAWRSGKKK